MNESDIDEIKYKKLLKNKKKYYEKIYKTIQHYLL